MLTKIVRIPNHGGKDVAKSFYIGMISPIENTEYSPILLLFSSFFTFVVNYCQP